MAFTGTEASAFDAWAIDTVGVPQATLMENAGRSAAWVLDALRPSGSVVVVAGSGNNGGDGVVVARTLVARGRDVTLVPVGTSPVDETLFHGWPLRVLDPAAGRDALRSADVIVDGILGTGLQGAPRDAQAAWIEAINGAPAFVIALDVPSGVVSDTGAVPGSAVHADLTVSFGGVKLGTVLQPGREHSGRLVAVEIGFPPAQEAHAGQWMITPGWASAERPARSAATHKNAVGVLTVVAGRPGMAGAAVLAARAALRAGAGLVRVVSAEANRPVIQEAVPEAIFVTREDGAAFGEALAIGRATLVGPGIGLDEDAERALSVVLEEAVGPVVVDADALTLLGEGRPSSLDQAAAGQPLLVTPHAGELARIHSASRAEAVSAPVTVSRGLAASTGAHVLLKGAPSVVAAPSGRVGIAGITSSDLAAAGMGDALAGAIVSFAAQGATLEHAAALGLHWTGRAALSVRKGAGLIPSDVVERLPDVLTETGAGDTDLPFGFVLFDQDLPR